MFKLNLPQYTFKLKTDGQKKQIFDPVRRKYIVLTSEEWVRQNFVQYLVQEKGYPQSLLTIERGLDLNGTKKRFDIVANNKQGKPVIIVECKSPKVKLSQETFDQITRYNIVLQVDYLIITNGIEHYSCKIDYTNKSYTFLKEIPSFQNL